MRNRFAFELIIGTAMLIAVLLFGTPGLAVLVLLSAHPFIGKKKMDEREIQLFYRVGNFTAGTVLLVSVIIFYFSETPINGILLGQNWFGLLLATFIGAHGAFGLILSREEKEDISNF